MISLVDLQSFYETNEDFKSYVDKYGKKHGMIEVIDILKSALIREAYKYYKEKEKIHEPEQCNRNSEFFKTGECT